MWRSSIARLIRLQHQNHAVNRGFPLHPSPKNPAIIAPGGLFVLHAKSLPGNPYDGHTLRDVIEDTQKLTGCEIERAYVDKGYRGHDAQNPGRVFISGQKRGVFGAIKRELRRRSAIEPVIGHMKAEGHLGRCYLKGRAGDAANTILTAVGYNFRRILAWLRALLRKIRIAILRAFFILVLVPAVQISARSFNHIAVDYRPAGSQCVPLRVC